MTSIMISHKLNEIRRVADQITVIRDGQSIETMDKADITEDRIVTSMVGRTLENRYPPRTPKIGETIFEVKNWSVYHPLHPERQSSRTSICMSGKGEVVGIAGLMGAGRTEFAMSVFGKLLRPQHHRRGLPARQEGRHLDGRPRGRRGPRLRHRGPQDLRPQPDRPHQAQCHYRQPARRRRSSGVIDDMRELKVANEYRRKTNIRSSSVYQITGNLSGGNQQKVVLSKWLFSNPDVLILDEPTRGIDVGAKYEIYTIINKLADEGKGILVISSEMPELLGICDRIYVLNEGRIVGEMKGRGQPGKDHARHRAGEGEQLEWAAS
jgi:putative multiple sugar transport system ATP-binding protein